VTGPAWLTVVMSTRTHAGARSYTRSSSCPNARSTLTHEVSSANARNTSASRSSVRSNASTGWPVQARRVSSRHAAHGCT